MTKLGPAVEDVPSEGSPAKVMKSVFVGALESHPEVASAALRSPPKNLYHLPQSEDGIFEPKENRQKKEMDRASLFYLLDKPPKVLHPTQIDYLPYEANAVQSDHWIYSTNQSMSDRQSIF